MKVLASVMPASLSQGPRAARCGPRTAALPRARALTPTVVLALAAAGCRPAAGEMAVHGHLRQYEPSPVFADGGSARQLPFGVVPRLAAHDGAVPRLPQQDGAVPRLTEPAGAVQRTHEGAVPGAPAGDAAALAPLSRELLLAGRERFEIWCSPCHGATGAGDGSVVQRGYPRPPAFTDERLRQASDAHLYQVLEHGLGKMPPYGPHVPPADRRPIVAWIRLLQRSQHGSLDDAPAAERRRLEAQPEARGR